MSDIVERLNDIWSNDDHERGCRGREYDCTCGFDDRTFATAKEAADTIKSLRARLLAAEKALEPFAEAGEVFAREYPDMHRKPDTSCGIKFSALWSAHQALSTLRAQGITKPDDGRILVKPLEWNEIEQARSVEDPSTEPTGDYEAMTPFGPYYIEMYFGSDSYGWAATFDGLPITGGDKDCPDKAKAAAQADYEQRILSALHSPRPEGDVE